MGLRRLRLHEPCWTETENELLMDMAHLSTNWIQEKLKKKGFHRTETAITVQRKRLGALVHGNSEAYSAHALANLLGVSPTPVKRWIRLGWLKATPRTESRNDSGGPGDRWLIFPRHVREFILKYTAHVDPSGADKFWLVDLLAGGDYARPRSIHHQESCGYSE